MGIVIQIAQLLLSLSILVLLHEFGHYFFARLFKTRVDKFYLFFDPWFSLFKYKRGETEWGIGWLPLGGYCKISGMIDESMDKEQLSKPAEPHEFRSKKAWQRLLIISGGVLVNFVLALIIYSGILFVWGEEYIKVADAKYGVEWSPAAEKIGLKDGDKVITLDGQEVEDFKELTTRMVIDNAHTLLVERGGEQKSITIPVDFAKLVMEDKRIPVAIPLTPFIVDTVLAGKPGEKAGLQKNDQIIGINNDSIFAFWSFHGAIQKYKNKKIALKVMRNNQPVTLSVQLNEEGLLGAGNKAPDYYFTITKKQFGFFASIPAGVMMGLETLGTYVKQFKLVFSKEGAQSIGGFGTIGGLFNKSWDWQSFWTMTALLSIILAFMNVLPIPALDGGHIIFILYEMLTGRKPSDKFLEYAQMTGMVLLLSLLLYANGNDIIRAFTN